MIDLTGVTTVADVPRVQSRLRGEAAAIVFEGRTTTFRQVDEISSRIANRLIADGVRPDERVAYLSKNSDHFLPFLFGATKARAVLTPINFRLAAPEIAYIVRDSGARLFVVGSDFIELAEKAIATLDDKPRLIALEFDREGYQRHDLWIGDAASNDPGLANSLDDDLVQLYTSGTTGYPKGVQLTHRNYMAALISRQARRPRL